MALTTMQKTVLGVIAAASVFSMVAGPLMGNREPPMTAQDKQVYTTFHKIRDCVMDKKAKTTQAEMDGIKASVREQLHIAANAAETDHEKAIEDQVLIEAKILPACYRDAGFDQKAYDSYQSRLSAFVKNHGMQKLLQSPQAR